MRPRAARRARDWLARVHGRWRVLGVRGRVLIEAAVLDPIAQRRSLDLQQLVRRMPAPPTIVKYCVKLARATRPSEPDALPDVKKYINYGTGPRASQYLVLGAKARAAMDGRAVPDIDDVRAIAMSVMRHRLVMNFQAEAEGMGADKLVQQVLEQQKSP